MTKVVMSVGEEYVGLTWEEAKRVIHAMDFYLGELDFVGTPPESYSEMKQLRDRIDVCKTTVEGGPEKRFRIGDRVELTESAAGGFDQGPGINMVVVDNVGYLVVACSNGVIFYPEPYEIRLLKEKSDAVRAA